MTKNEKINELIAELVAMEPELRGREQKLTEVLNQMLELDDKVHIDEAFKRNLKARLLEVAEKNNLSTNNIKNLFMKRMSLVLCGLVLVLAGVAGGGWYMSQNGSPFNYKQAAKLFSGEAKIAEVGKNAFGSLANTNSSADQQPLADGTVDQREMAMLNNSSAPTSSATQAMPAMDRKIAYGMGGGADMSIAPPYYMPYKFVYKGEKFNIEEAEGDVFRRVKNSIGTGPISNILRTVSLGLLDLNKFKNLNVQSFTLMEDMDFGYMVTVNSQEGSVYINENWEKWSHPEYQCQDEACFERYRLKPGDVPGDDEIISITNQFLDSYAINRGSYGDPSVQKNFYDPIAYSGMPQTEIYIPDVVSVVYPLKLADQVITDESGNPTGLYVSVNIRHKKVSSVSDLNSQNYESSKYALETDTNRILKFAEGSGYGYYPDEQTSENSGEVYLGTPSRGLIRTWTYSTNTSQELFVPALVFPITGASSKDIQHYQKYVVVPLVKEILDERGKIPTPPYPIMPMEKSVPESGTVEGRPMPGPQ